MPKAIITAAITGAIHVPTMSDYLPITPEEIIEEVVRAHEAGAAVVHIHARDPQNGKPSSDLEIYRKILIGIKQRCDVVVCITTGGALGLNMEERISVVKEFEPEMASFNMGSMNLGLYPLLGRYQSFKHSWERDYLAMTEDFTFTNTFKTMKYFCETMNEHNTLPELEIYDTGMINNTAHLIDQGILKKPVYLQFVLGILGGIPATVENLQFMYNTAKNLIKDFNWSVCGAGKQQFAVGVTNLILGGNMRVGLEDSLYISRGVLAKNNSEQVAKAARIAGELGIEVASAKDARQMLGLKGLDKVKY